MEYKVGDKITIVSRPIAACWNNEMLKWLTKDMTVKEIKHWGYGMEEDNGNWCWHKHMIAGLADGSESEKVNLMPEVAALLGVEIGEEFEIEGVSAEFMKITEDELVDQYGHDWSTSLYRLLTGKWKIVEKPWKPEDGSKYYIVTSDGMIIWDRFNGTDFCDCALLHAGNCFRTKEEAVANRETIMEKFGWK